MAAVQASIKPKVASESFIKIKIDRSLYYNFFLDKDRFGLRINRVECQ